MMRTAEPRMQVDPTYVVAPELPATDAVNWPWNLTRVVTVTAWYDPARSDPADVAALAQSMTTSAAWDYWPTAFQTDFSIVQLVRAVGASFAPLALTRCAHSPSVAPPVPWRACAPCCTAPHPVDCPDCAAAAAPARAAPAGEPPGCSLVAESC